ncbi:MAG: POTRA domain-containing protein, partial [Verrucomicrobiota bacterium]
MNSNFALTFVLLVLVPLLPWVPVSSAAGPSLEVFGGGMSEPAVREMIADHWGEIETRGLSRSRADDAAFLLRRALRQKGFVEAEVSWELMPGNRLQLKISQGPKKRIGLITVSGLDDAEEDQDALRRLLVEKAEGRSTLIDRVDQSDLPFVPLEIEAGRLRAERFLAQKGYLDAAVRIETEDRGKGRTDLRVVVDRGDRYTVGSVELEGLNEEQVSWCREPVDQAVGEPLSKEVVSRLEKEIAGEFRRRGFYQALLTTGPVPDRTEVGGIARALLVSVEPGNPFNVRRVRVSGQKEVKESFLKKRFKVLEGKPYDEEAVNEVFRTLAISGLFSSVDIKPRPVDGQELELDVNVTEARFRELGIYGGYGSFDQAIVGASWIQRNVIGRGRPLTGRLELNGRGYEGEIS